MSLLGCADGRPLARSVKDSCGARDRRVATYRLIGLVFVLVLGAACGAADGSSRSEESIPSGSELQETVTISVADGCATLTDPDSGSELVTTCEPPLSNPLFVWGDDTSAASVNLIRVPPGTGLERTQGDFFNVSYDMASGWLKIEYAQQPPLVFLTQNDELFRCELQLAALVCRRA